MERPKEGRKLDRRTRYTRQAIRDTLLELMEEKPFSHALSQSRSANGRR